MNKIGIVIALVIAAVFIFLSRERFMPQEQMEVPPTPSPMPEAEVPESWEKYSDDDWGVSFAIPRGYAIETNGDWSVLSIPPVNEKYPAGNARFFYISVVPESLSDDETAQVYNYSASFHKKLMDMEVNDTVNLSENEGQGDWYQYSRFDDETFNGKTARVFVNQRPWEFPEGTREYRYVFEAQDRTVIAGAYIDGGSSDAPFTLPILIKIMNTLVID